jgi:hypothetical protein
MAASYPPWGDTVKRINALEACQNINTLPCKHGDFPALGLGAQKFHRGCRYWLAAIERVMWIVKAAVKNRSVSASVWRLWGVDSIGEIHSR